MKTLTFAVFSLVSYLAFSSLSQAQSPVASPTPSVVNPVNAIVSSAGYRFIERADGELNQAVLSLSFQAGNTPLENNTEDGFTGRLRLDLHGLVPTPNPRYGLTARAMGEGWYHWGRDRTAGNYAAHLRLESEFAPTGVYPATGRIGICGVGPVAPEDSGRINLFLCIDLIGGVGLEGTTNDADFVRGFGLAGAVAIPVAYSPRRLRFDLDFSLLGVAQSDAVAATPDDANAVIRYIFSAQVPVPQAGAVALVFGVQGATAIRYGDRASGSITAATATHPVLSRGFFEFDAGVLFNY